MDLDGRGLLWDCRHDALGAWAGKMKLVTRIQENLKSWKVWVPAVLCAASYYLLIATAGQGRYTLGYGPGYTVLTCALLTAFGGYLFLVAGILLEKVPGVRWILEYIGRNSLYFLLMHMFLGCILNDLTGWNLSMANFDMTKTMNAFSGSWGWEQVVGMVLVMILCGLYAALVRKLKSVRLQRKEAV